jgi:pimeloyl-ACP methyl ester carboxylesterase
MSPLIILHGLFGSSLNWARLSRIIAAECNTSVKALDLRNHNCPENSSGSKISSWDTLSSDLEKYWQYDLNRADFNLLGHSLVY